MKVNSYGLISGNRFFSRALACALFFLFIFTPQIAFADAMPPPNPPFTIQIDRNTPVGYDLQKMGASYDANGRPVIDMNKFKNYSNNWHKDGSTYTGKGNANITATDKYGAKASTSVKTTTKINATNANIAKGLGAAMVAQMGAQHLNNMVDQGVQGMMTDAMESGKVSDWVKVAAKLADWTGLGNAIANQLYQNHDFQSGMQQTIYENIQNQAKKDYNYLDPQNYKNYNLYIVKYTSTDIVYFSVLKDSSVKTDNTYSQSIASEFKHPYQICWTDGHCINLPTDKNVFFSIYKYKATPEDIEAYNAQNGPQLADVMPTEQQIIDLLTQLLNANQATNEILNAAISQGVINGGNSSTDLDLDSPQVFTTEPYTPQGSSIPQQTQFTVDKDGNVSAQTVQRPDLSANSTQAPTRAPINNSTSTSTQTGSTAEVRQETPDICAVNPNSVMCMPQGDDSYEDPKIPSVNVDVSFNPIDVFSSDGVCPQPLTFSVFGKDYAFSYDNACTFMGGIRPIVIGSAMIVAMFIVYSALKDY